MNPSPYHAPFTSAHFRATIVKILLIAGAVVTGLYLLVETLSLAFPPLSSGEAPGENPMGVLVVLAIFLLAVFSLIIYVPTVIFFCVWLYRAYDNLRAFNQWSRPEYSPGWAVGSFFVPFVNLVVPYRAVRETWQKSRTAEEARLSEPSPPASFPVWWTFWLLACFAGNISMRAGFNDRVPESAATILSIIASGLSVVAAVFAYVVVDTVDKQQEETSQKLKLGAFPLPPPPPANLPPSDAGTPLPIPNNPQSEVQV